MNEVSVFRLYLLRFVYIILFAGTAVTIWPQLINPSQSLTLWRGVGCSLLAAMSVMAALGIRYPLAMIPVLFFELTWKVIWLLVIALPLWSAGQMDAAHLETAQNCLMGVIVPIAIPWRYVWTYYVRKPGDRWK
jgi:hypothetical protein